MNQGSAKFLGLGLAQWLAAALMLQWVWAYNGGPILYGDSGQYLLSAQTCNLLSYRPSGYPLLLLPALWAGGLWPLLWLQAGVTAWLLLRLLRLELNFGPWRSLTAVLGLCLFTTLPWWVVTVMSDLWASLIALAAYMLLFHWGGVGRAERVALTLVLLLGLVSHISAVLILAATLGLLALLGGAGRLLGGTRLKIRGAGAITVCAALIAGGLFFPVANLWQHQTAAPATGAARLALARVAVDGLLLDMLQERCGDPAYYQYSLCAHLKPLEKLLSLPPEKNPTNYCPCSQEGFVTWILNFGRIAPLRDAYVKEGATDAGRTLWDSLLYHPWGHVKAVIKGTWDIYGNSVISPFINGKLATAGIIKRFFPINNYRDFKDARTVKGTLRLEFFNGYLLPLVWLGGAVSLVGLIVLLLGRRLVSRLPEKYFHWARLAAFCLAFTLANALIMYAAVGDHTRYQSRCSWLVAMQPVLILVLALYRRRPAQDGRAN
ncbi:MAG: hypothetical protein KQI62_05575 [Deltaproteobacteria bacterium]|nr:hypothetical protein [Deltaproteobacteria bacterium]